MKRRNKEEDRFQVVYRQEKAFPYADVIEVLLDRETGVNYLHHITGATGHTIPLLGSDGKPLVTETEKEDITF